MTEPHYPTFAMFRKLTLITILLALCTIALGTYVRVSGAGLACPDWPSCTAGVLGTAPPPAMGTGAGEAKAAALDTGIAMGHRYLSAVVAAVILVLALVVWRLRENRLRTAILTLTSLGVVILQGALSFWLIELRLLPLVVTAHLLLGFTLLALLYSAYLSATPGGLKTFGVGLGQRGLARLALLALVVEIAAGAWSSANFAGLACPDFPTCLGQPWPEADYATGFGASAAASGTSSLTIGGRVAIHWLHRIGALGTFLLLTALALGISSSRRFPGLSRTGVWLSFWLLAEVALGIATLIFKLHAAAVVAHSVVAGVLLLNVLHVNLRLRRPTPVAQTSPTPAIPEERQPPPPRPVVAPAPEVVPPAAPVSLFDRLRSQLGKTRGGFTGVLANLALGRKAIDRELLEEIEERLLMADLGVTATGAIIDDLTGSLERHELRDWDVLNARLRGQLLDILSPCSAPLVIPPDTRPFVILVVGVNGVGKTTTIGKLAKRLQNQGHSVMLAAGDTFRAAAVEQLQRWGERNEIPVIAQSSGSDSASVIYDAVQAAQARGIDVLIADTAGRLHTKSNLMEELRKIKRIIGKLDTTAPHEVLLVLDAGTGQNAIAQARQFNEAVSLTGLALTKLDGTAKGGVIFALAKQFGIPIRYIGIGEGIEDLQDFDAEKFIAALFEERLH